MEEDIPSLKKKIQILKKGVQDLRQEKAELLDRIAQLQQEKACTVSSLTDVDSLQESNRLLQAKFERLTDMYSQLTEQNYVLLEDISKRDDERRCTCRTEIQALKNKQKCLIILRDNFQNEPVIQIESADDIVQILVTSITDFEPTVSEKKFKLTFKENQVKKSEQFEIPQEFEQFCRTIRDFLKQNQTRKQNYDRLAPWM